VLLKTAHIDLAHNLSHSFIGHHEVEAQGTRSEDGKTVSVRNALTQKTNGREESPALKLVSRPFEEDTHMNFASVSSLWHRAG
jgi:hypothetical protein